jgi:hypothetical protein
MSRSSSADFFSTSFQNGLSSFGISNNNGTQEQQQQQNFPNKRSKTPQPNDQ